MIHSFDTDHAELFGIEEAILMQNLWFWIKKNKANESHFYEGRTWTYNSVKAFGELFPYMTEKTIRGALKKLIDVNVLVTGNFSKGTDRTLWYAFFDESIFENSRLELPKMAKAFARKGKCSITDSNTDNKPNSKQQGALFPELLLPYGNNFKAKWSEWLKFKKERKEKFTELTAEKQLKTLAALNNEDNAIATIDRSIQNGWRGLFPYSNSAANQLHTANQSNQKSRFVE